MKPTLIHVAVGNNPSRVRMVMYIKQLVEKIDLKTPADYGGTSSPEYRALNPQGKIPVLILPDGRSLYESRVISAYLVDKYADCGPNLLAETPEARAQASLINSIHDLYIASPNSSDPAVTANQGCAYKGVDLIDAPSRHAKLKEVARQVGVLEQLIVGPYAAGNSLTEADCALYPSFAIFLPHCLKHAFGWPSLIGAEHPNLTAWLAEMEKLPAAQRLRSEMEPALQGWVDNGRFEPIKTQVAAADTLSWERQAILADL